MMIDREVIRSLIQKADDDEFREGLRQMGEAAERSRKIIERRMTERPTNHDPEGEVDGGKD